MSALSAERQRWTEAASSRLRPQQHYGDARKRGLVGEPGVPLRFEAFHEHVDLAAAGQPDRPGLLVRDAVREELRLSRREHLAGVLVDVRLDAAARDRA